MTGNVDAGERDLFEARPSWAGRRFRRGFIRALNRLEGTKTITAEKRRELSLAAYSVIPIPGAGNRCLIECVYQDCRKMAQASGDFMDTLRDWWQAIVSWIVENWPTILQILMTFVMFI